MKFTQNLLTLLALSLFLFACGGAPEGEKVEAGEKVETTENASSQAEAFKVNTAESKIMWTGSKVIGGGQHTGTMNLQAGDIMVADGNITGGKFVVDVASLANTDLTPEDGKADLEGHLKSDDFFDVANHPTAVFEIAKVEAASGDSGATHTITGNFTLKGVTKSVTIPAKVAIQDGKLIANTPPFVIDRTQWGVKYGSGVIGVVQDEAISDEVGLQLSIAAAK
jgi:polyisoprenoid-binding protein YceI